MADLPFKAKAEPIITGSAREGSGIPRWKVTGEGERQPKMSKRRKCYVVHRYYGNTSLC